MRDALRCASSKHIYAYPDIPGLFISQAPAVSRGCQNGGAVAELVCLFTCLISWHVRLMSIG